MCNKHTLVLQKDIQKGFQATVRSEDSLPTVKQGISIQLSSCWIFLWMLLDYLIFRGWAHKEFMVSAYILVNSHSGLLYTFVCLLVSLYFETNLNIREVLLCFSWCFKLHLKNIAFVDCLANSARTAHVEWWMAVGLTPWSWATLLPRGRSTYYLGLTKEQALGRHLKITGVKFFNRVL